VSFERADANARRTASISSTGSDGTRFLWAKTGDGVPGWHPLVLHLLDVAASADAILEREPEATRRRMGEVLGLPWGEARPWLLFVIACHDLGKACPPFQAKWPQLIASTGLRMPRGTNTTVNHGFVSQMVLVDALRELGWPEALAELAADAVGCHHGERAPESGKDAAEAVVRSRDPAAQDWGFARMAVIAQLIGVFLPGSPPTKPALTGPDFMLLAGLTSFADWIGSNTDWFKFGTPDDCDDLAGWFARRRRTAERSLDEIGWAPRTPLAAKPQNLASAVGHAPRPLQCAVERVVAGLDAPAVLLVEAPMGEGKTEAAFFAHLELQRRFGHRGMYVALPTKATGNAMFDRTLAFLRRYDAKRRLDLQLAHGAKLLNDRFVQLRLSRIDDEQPLGEVRAAAWFTHRKRALLSEYGVGTVDQALVTVLPVRHNFVRLWGLANRVVVLDEVHAYDAYTGTLLQQLVAWLQALGSSVVLLSATLSPSIRRRLARVTDSELPDEEQHYPRISVFRPGCEAQQFHFEADSGRRQRVSVCGIGAHVDAIRAAVADHLPHEGVGLALVNTVQRAQALYRRFPDGAPIRHEGVVVGKRLADGTRVLLFHARFPAEERQARENAALATFGLNRAREGRCILIATQVAEQSLDLDFDVMVTDLAPIDLILQRAGRLWRHDRGPRPVSEARLFVAGLEGDEPPEFGRPLWWGRVYREDLLLRSWIVLKAHSRLTLPDDIDPLVVAVYEDRVSVPPSLLERMERAEREAEGSDHARRTQAYMALIGAPNDRSWDDPSRFVLYDEDSPHLHRTLMAHTRLGESVTAIPIGPDEAFRRDAVPTEAEAKQWYLRGMSLSRAGVVSRLRGIGVPEGWTKSPLLRDCIPLTLDANGRWAEDSAVRLDPELGLVYDDKEPE
jgi:CRISPR-associated endonuclease/helicase Cas3